MFVKASHQEMVRTKGIPVARALMGLLFVFSGIGMLFIQGPAATAGYFDSMGVPMAGLLVWVVIAIKLGAGGALMAGYKVADAAMLLIVFTLLSTVVAHMSLEDINLFKNLAIVGGLLYAIAYAPAAAPTAPRRDEVPQM